MGNPLEDIDDIFKKQINSIQDIPDTGIWENIALHLNNETNKKYKRKFIYWRSAAAIVAAVFLILLLLYLSIDPIGHSDKPIVKQDVFNHSLSNQHQRGNISDNIDVKQQKIHAANQTDSNVLHVTVKPAGVSSEGFIHTNDQIITHASQQKNKPYKKQGIIPIPIHVLYHDGIYRALKKPLSVEAVSANSALQTKINFDDIVKPFDLNYFNKGNNQYLFNLPVQMPSIQGTSMLISKFSTIKQHPYSITAMAAPYLMNYFNNASGNINNQPGQGYQHGNQGENNELSYSIGILVQYTKKHWQFSTGLQYAQSFVTIQPKTIYASQNPNGIVQYKYTTSTGYAFVSPSFSSQPQIGDSLYTTTAKHTLQYFSIPFRIGYQFNKNKLAVIPTLGIALNMLHNATIETNFDNGSQSEQEVINSLQGLKKMYFSVFAGTSFQYIIHSGISVFISPNLQMGLQSITNPTLPSSIPYQLGIESGINISF